MNVCILTCICWVLKVESNKKNPVIRKLGIDGLDFGWFLLKKLKCELLVRLVENY